LIKSFVQIKIFNLSGLSIKAIIVRSAAILIYRCAWYAQIGPPSL